VVTGARPPNLGGYEENPIAAKVRDRLEEILGAKRELHDDLVVLTGLGLGADQLGAEAAVAASVPFFAVLAYPEQEAVWPEASQARYRDLLKQAAGEILLQERRPENRQQAGRALARRDAWLLRHADEALVIWDEKDPVVGRLARSFEDRLGDDVWVVKPE
jgi:uncharacterized phage-like protein YoqJ